MSEDFLSRWSRRKREVAKAEQEPPQPAAEAPAPEQESVTQQTETQEADEVDLSSLPPIEEITGTTDISGFLRRGVPEELKRSALRKVWTSDPAIRDFIGLSENSWDFNDPNAIPGFGPIDFSPEQVRQMAAKLVGDVREASEQIERVAGSAMQQEIAADDSAPAKISSDAERATASEPLAQSSDAAAQNKNSTEASVTEHIEEPVEVRRRHGGALPR